MISTHSGVRSARPVIAFAVLAALAALFTALFTALPNIGATAAPASVAKPSKPADTSSKIKKAAVGIWADSVVPAVSSRNDKHSVTLGLDFSSEVPGRLYGIQYYAAGKNRAATTGRVWNARGKQVAKVRFPQSSTDDWKTAWFSSPVKIRAGKTYTASYRAPKGRYAIEQKSLGRKKDVVANGLTAHRGTFVRGPGRPTKTWHGSHYFIDVAFVPKAAGDDTTPTPNPTPTPTPTPNPGAFPDASNTGVPAGVALAGYSGPSTISTPGTVIDAKQVNGGLIITAPGVVISRSQVNGNITIEESGSLAISDSLVDGGTFDGSAVGQYNITMKRVNVIGARQSVSCNDNCDIQDSWLHAQYIQPGSDWHGDGFTSNGGNNVLLRHNTLACDSKPTGNGACSAAVASYGDFGPITNHTYDNNLFVSSPAGYCMYAGYDPAKPYGADAKNVVVTNNVFARGTSGKCAVYGPVAAVAPSGNGNVFSGNVWDDGKAISAP